MYGRADKATFCCSYVVTVSAEKRWPLQAECLDAKNVLPLLFFYYSA